MKGNTNAAQANNRRSFLRGTLATGAAVVGGTVVGGDKAFAQNSGQSLTSGDIAILRFLAAAELIESDLWQQYAELGGLTSGQPIEVDPNQQLNSYQAALSNLDSDGPQYISSNNTFDEVSHATFWNSKAQTRWISANSKLYREERLQEHKISGASRTSWISTSIRAGSSVIAVQLTQTSAPPILKR